MLSRLIRIARIKLARRAIRPRRYKQAPPLRHPERLHHSTARSEVPVAIIDWEALRLRDALRRAAGYQ